MWGVGVGLNAIIMVVTEMMRLGGGGGGGGVCQAMSEETWLFFVRISLHVHYNSIGGKVLEWIRGWLTSRKQRVQINGKKSEWGTTGISTRTVVIHNLYK